MSDFLSQLPSVAFRKIYRELDPWDQFNLYSALEESNAEDCLTAVENYKQKVQCWLCQARLFMNSFWHCGGLRKNYEPESKYLKFEPKIGSDGFNIMYTHVCGESDSRTGALYRVRNFQNLADMQIPDEIFMSFQEELGKVFTADNSADLWAHLKSVHELDHTNNFNDEFYKGLFCHEGQCFTFIVELNLSNLYCNIIINFRGNTSPH